MPVFQPCGLSPAGADTLKSALQALGLKCGGTLRQRAERLMLTKTTPLEQLDQKLFVKGAAPQVGRLHSLLRPVPWQDLCTAGCCLQPAAPSAGL